METYPTFRFIYDRRRIATPSKPAEICLEINYASQRKFISTRIRVLPDEWRDGKIVNHPKKETLNRGLDVIMEKYECIINQHIKENPYFRLDNLNLRDNKNSESTFIDYVSERIDTRQDIRKSTKKNHRRLLSALHEFELIQNFHDLTKQNILKYDEYLHTKNYTQTTIYTYHKVLKTYIHDAIIHDKIAYDPYLGLKVDKGKSKGRKYLTDDEILKIKRCEYLPKSLENIRDLFIFQCYTGMGFSDLMNFDSNKLIERNGKYIYQDKRIKTDEEYYLVLLSPALEILKKYNYQLPKITNQQYNLRLKSVVAIAGIERKITSHMARHSFAVMCLNKGLSMESVSKMLGHTNTNTTQLYAKLLNSKLEQDFDFLEGLI